MKKLLYEATRLHRHSGLSAIVSLSVSVFLIFTGLITNRRIIEILGRAEYTLPILLSALVCILALHAFLFQHYLSASLLAEKAKDYGILASLGQSRQIIVLAFIKGQAKFLLIAVLTGLSAGLLLYAGALALLCRFLDTNLHGFPVYGCLLVHIVYIFIFLYNAAAVYRTIGKLSVCRLLNYKKSARRLPNSRRCLWAGLLLLAAGTLMLLLPKNRSSYSLASALLPMLLLSAGAYFLVLTFPNWFAKWIAASHSGYYRNLFYISQLRTTFKNYARLLTACTIIILFGLSLLSLDLNYCLREDDHTFEKPFDFSISIADLPEALPAIRSFEDRAGGLIARSQTAEMMDAAIQWDGDGYSLPVNIMPEISYTGLTGRSLGLNRGEIAVLTQLLREHYQLGIQADNGIEWGFQPPGPVTYSVNGLLCFGIVRKELWEAVFNLEDQNRRTYVLTDQDYDSIIQNTGVRPCKYFVNAAEENDRAILFKELRRMPLCTSLPH